jgi:hypothetical protein
MLFFTMSNDCRASSSPNIQKRQTDAEAAQPSANGASYKRAACCDEIGDHPARRLIRDAADFVRHNRIRQLHHHLPRPVR